MAHRQRQPTHVAPDRRLVARSLGLFFVAAPAVAELWLLLPGVATPHAAALLVTSVIAQLLGVLFCAGALDAAPAPLLKALLTLATIVAAALYAFSGSADSGFAYLFLWATPLAFSFGLRHAVLQSALAASALVGVQALVGSGTQHGHAGSWLLPLATLVMIGTVVHRLVRELGRADRERLASERERAESESARAAGERERARREAAIGRLGRLALRAPDRQTLLREAVGVLTETLGVEHCDILELVDGAPAVRRAAGTDAEPADQEAPGGDRLLTGWVLAVDEPVLVREWATERRLSASYLRRRGVRSTAAAGIRGRSGAFGVVAVHAERTDAFSEEDGRWLQAIADLLASALDRERAEAAMRHQILHDALTGLPNRALLFDRIGHAFARAERAGTSVALLLLDVDDFKTVNDSLGHDAGDDLLVQVGFRLQQVIRGMDTVARLGGDEFVILADVASDEEAFAVAGRIEAAWGRPFAVGAGGEVFVTSSVGITVAREHEAPDRLLREADAAMYRAKQSGPGRHVLFGEEVRRDAVERVRTESDLRRAVQGDEFVVFYQPIYDLRSGRVTSVEALVRWMRPGVGLVEPADFIALAEETGLIAPLGRWVLEHAAAQVSRWRGRFPGASELGLSVNVSGRQIARPEFLDEVCAALAAADLPAGALGLELTESVLMEDVTAPRSTIEALRGLGLRLLIDDFGTGYSSLARLRRFPLDAIKIDRSFVTEVGHDGEDAAIVAAIVEVAGSLGLGVIAEGVETADQLERLVELGCHSAQGFLFAHPQQADRLERLLAAQGHAGIGA